MAQVLLEPRHTCPAPWERPRSGNVCPRAQAQRCWQPVFLIPLTHRHAAVLHRLVAGQNPAPSTDGQPLRPSWKHLVGYGERDFPWYEYWKSISVLPSVALFPLRWFQGEGPQSVLKNVSEFSYGAFLGLHSVSAIKTLYLKEMRHSK